MKKQILLPIILLSQIFFGQVTLEKNTLVKDGQTYKMSQYEQVFSNPKALAYVKKSRNNGTFATIFGIAGGAAVGAGLGNIIFNNKTHRQQVMGYTFETKPDHSVAWLVTGIGAGLIAIGVPFAVSSAKNLKKAILAENGESTAFQPYFKVESAGIGFALSYNF